MEKVPLMVYLYDLIYFKEPTVDLPIIKRREILENNVNTANDKLNLSDSVRVTEENIHDAVELFNKSIEGNHEGIMIKIINGLKEKGFKISMDDFGTGYSSLALLTIIPMDTIKIDKSFVDGIGPEEKDIKSCTLINHIISMTRDLNFTCLAEGAEKKEQVDLLREFGCEIVQGYYYSKPVPKEEYEKLL